MDYRPILEPTVFQELPQDIIIDDIIILAQSCDSVIHWMRKFGLLARGMRCRCGTEVYEFFPVAICNKVVCHKG